MQPIRSKHATIYKHCVICVCGKEDMLCHISGTSFLVCLLEDMSLYALLKGATNQGLHAGPDAIVVLRSPNFVNIY